MKIAEGVEMLEIASNISGNTSTMNPTLIWDGDTVILIDAGLPGQLPQLREAVEKSGIKFESIQKIIVTHHDIDHIGNLTAVQNELPDATVYAHREEKPYIEGAKTWLKLAGLEARFDSLNEQMKLMYDRMKAVFQTNKARVDRELEDGDVLPFCGGIEVIFTPGHTLGHICLYLKQSRTLIAGDLLVIGGGELMKADSAINYDNEMTLKSLKRLTEYDIDKVICYHGGAYSGDANRRIAEL